MPTLAGKIERGRRETRKSSRVEDGYNAKVKKMITE